MADKILSLCLLTWNEIEGCKMDVPRIPPIFDRIYALDNNSNDGTVEFLNDAGIEVINQESKSYNGAYIDAIHQAKDSSIIFFHPKGTIDIESLEIAVERMRSGVDFLLASRNTRGARNEEDDKTLKPRKWFVILIALISKIRWGISRRVFLDDPLHGYRGLSNQFIKTLVLRENTVTADLEMIRHAYKRSFDIQVIPVKESPRINGSTHFPAFSTGKKILKYILLS